MATRVVSVCCSSKLQHHETTRQGAPQRTNGSTARRLKSQRKAVCKKRPSLEGIHSESGNNLTLEQKLAKASQIEPYLAHSINQYSARDALNHIDSALKGSSLMSHGDVIYLARLIGMILIRSPIQPADIALRPIVNRLSVIVEERLPDLSTSDLCGVVWVYGCFGPSALMPSLFKGVRKLVMKVCMRIEGESVQSVRDAVCLFSGLAEMEFLGHSGVTSQTLRKLVPVLSLQQFSASDLAKLVLQVGNLRVPGGIHFLRKASRLMKDRFRECTDEALCDFVRGFANYDAKISPGAFDEVTAEAQIRLPSMEISLLINLTHSLSKIHYLPSEDFLKGLSQRIVAAPAKLTAKDLAGCSIALGHLNYHSPEVMAVLVERFEFLKRMMTFKEICSLLIGFVRLDALTEELLVTGLKALKKELSHGIEKQQKLMVHQILTHAKLFLKMDSIDEHLFPGKWQRACQDAWIRDQKRPRCKSEAAFVKTAKQLGLTIQQGYSQIGDLSIYTLRSLDGKEKLVIDLVIEKSHCYINQPKMMLLWKQWQYRVLEAQGYKMLPVVEQVWLQVPEVSRMRHLATKLDFWSLEEIIAMEEATGVRMREKAVQ